MDIYTIMILTFIFIIGLCVGSFLNVVVLRALSGESIVLPRSKCPSCGEQLKWWHNIPVFSYVLLRGKCGFCNERISVQYPIIELITGVVFVLAFMKYGVNIQTVFTMAVASLFIVIAGTDMKEKVVYDMHTYSIIALGLLAGIISTAFAYFKNGGIGWFNPLTNALLGIVLAVIIMEACARIGYLFAKTRAFGEGDTFIAAAIGSIFGWFGLLLVLALSLAIQVVFTLPVFIKNLIVKKDFKTLITSVVFFLYSAVFFTVQHFGLLSNDWVYIAAATVMAVIGFVLCRMILKGIQDKPEEMTFLPFGPAMVLATLIFLLT